MYKFKIEMLQRLLTYLLKDTVLPTANLIGHFMLFSPYFWNAGPKKFGGRPIYDLILYFGQIWPKTVKILEIYRKLRVSFCPPPHWL